MVERLCKSAYTHQRDQRLVYHTIDFPDFEGTMLLDESVVRLLPVPKPPVCKMGFMALFRVGMTKNKGWGLFATKDIGVDEVILVENPVLVVYPFTVLNVDIPSSRLFHALFYRFKPSVREQALALDDCSELEDGEKCGREEGIMRTNGFAITLPIPEGENVPESLHSGLFLTASRCNHR